MNPWLLLALLWISLDLAVVLILYAFRLHAEAEEWDSIADHYEQMAALKPREMPLV